ncbi:MAG TPA: pyridoxine 5'-phosphate synthase [Polyangiaceae bacterium]|nr:pyridoxine 5'-phosphate synthase [Polyangiaceae bacterium]
MTRLSVNVNKVALLRNSREGQIPSVTKAARLCLDAGAHGITVHPRPDARHIRPSDVADLKQVLAEPAYRHAEFNIEGNPLGEGFLELVEAAAPHQCTLVPDSPSQATSDHGWDLDADAERLLPVIRRLRGWGCRVSLFMDPEPERIGRAADVGADRVELYTASYAVAHARGGVDRAASLATFRRAAERAQAVGLGVNAGHDLNLDNLADFVTIAGILEVSIGHALVADALETGFPATVRAYLARAAGGAGEG